MELLKIFLAVLAVLSGVLAAPSEKLTAITVTNGGPAGYWGAFELCPDGTFAGGFSVKTEKYVNPGDNTAVNGIRLHCSDGVNPQETLITSATEKWGNWGPRINCLGNAYIQKFRLQVTPNLDSVNDKTAVNNIEFTCTNAEVLLGDGINRGDWGEYSDTCSKGICGLQTLVQTDSGTFVDDTSLNDVKFLCC